jgi:hypothetical protein
MNPGASKEDGEYLEIGIETSQKYTFDAALLRLRFPRNVMCCLLGHDEIPLGPE